MDTERSWTELVVVAVMAVNGMVGFRASVVVVVADISGKGEVGETIVTKHGVGVEAGTTWNMKWWSLQDGICWLCLLWFVL